MKKLVIISLILFFNVLTMSSQTSNNKYEKEWEEVSKFEKESLPQSASKIVNEILQKAIDEQNVTQAIKAVIYKNKYDIVIDADNNDRIFADFALLLDKTNDVSEKALLHSMLAELYIDYYQSDQWNINQRSNLSDFTPADIKEWTASIFKEKIIEHLNQSLSDIDLLKKHTTKDYEIILLGTVGQKYYPTMYDFLMVRAIEIGKSLTRMGNEEFDLSSVGVGMDKLVVPADEYVNLNFGTKDDKRFLVLDYYKQYSKDLLSRGLLQTVILTDIDRIDFLERKSRSFSDKNAKEAYTKLYEKYKTNEAAVEIIAKITDSFGYDDNQHDVNKEKYYWLTKGIKEYPDYYAINILKEKLVSLEAPALNITGYTLYYPNKKAEVEIFYKNIQELKDKPQFKLYQLINGRYSVVKSYPLILVSKTTYNQDTLKLDLGLLPVGKYSFSSLSAEELADNSNTYKEDRQNRLDFVVSGLISFSRNSAKDEFEIFVTDRMTGKPTKGAAVDVYTDDYQDEKLLTTLTTDELGRVIYKKETDGSKDNNIAYKVRLGADSCLEKAVVYSQNYRWNVSNVSSDNSPVTTVLIDRNIYRPGQTVYFKAITIGKDSKIVPNKRMIVKLYNPNREEVAQKELVTNEFGSISDNFILPKSGLLGGYSIEVEQSSVYFNVEEYKRPTFEITFDKVEKTYTFGEEVTVKGYAKNFSGISLQDTDVKYAITREQFMLWPWRSGNISQISDGVIKTSADGSFEITFIPEASDGNASLYRVNNKDIYTFNISATVTDINGETQSNNFSLTVANVSMVINIDAPEQIEKSEEYNLEIKARNLQAQEIETTGSYVLYKLNDEDSIQTKVLEGSFKTGKQEELKRKIKGIPSGKYQLQVKAFDDKKNEINEKRNFVLYSYNDKRPPIKTSEWLVEKNTKFGEKQVEIVYGTTDKEAYVLYQLLNNDKVFESRFVKLGNSNHTFTVPYRDEYGKEIIMSLTSVREGKFYNQNIRLQKEEKVVDTKLNIKMEVFRDKLRPGQNETWTISVKDTTNMPVAAEILASMYDTSLDKLYPYSPWNINYPQANGEYIYPAYYRITGYRGKFPHRFYLDYQVTKLEEVKRTIDAIYWFGYIGYYNQANKMAGSIYSDRDIMDCIYSINAGEERPFYSVEVAEPQASSDFNLRLSKARVTKSLLAEPTIKLMEDASAEVEFSAGWGQTGKLDTRGEAIKERQIRQNFAETAFFFPTLRTNEKGETLISFTVPESNTTWRFRALAHDKDARTGMLEKMVMTRKELMVTPNMPRFVRQGDKTSISTKISNLSENAISGDVRIEFFDPMTDEIINLDITNSVQSFSIEKDASTSASWTFDIPRDIELLGCRIVAQNETFSDGEQHVLAVLSNRMLVTESMPIDVNKAGTSTFTFDKLYNNQSASSDNYRLTLEYASNPAWYAVQALPTMSNPTNENAVNWFASYYVNTLGSSIVRQYPKVAAMIQVWTNQGGNEQTLVSKLQKDEELKTVLLEETPWVLDAKTETEQMQRLSLLFDLNNTKQLTDMATSKLADLQTNTGGWGWYKGFYPARSMTQYILYGYAKLQQVGQVQYPEQIKVMQMDALKYIDKQILDDFNNLKKNNKDWEKTTYVSTNQLEFAFVRSYYRDIPINQETREAERFYTNVASKNWTKLSLYERAILSMVLKRNGDKDLAKKIVKSIKEHAVNDKRLGMYWPNNRSNAFMSMSAITTHVFLMEALQENGATVKEMDAMKRWLLAQKQTQQWESTHATIDAISALLGTGSDWFSVDTSATVKVGNVIVEPENKEIGTGYFKESWSKSEIRTEMGKVEVTTPSSSPAYGALYWQYYEDLDKITAQGQDEELNVEKQLFKEAVTGTGKSLSLITENNPLKVGDKAVIRLTVRVSQDMEFVHLKDMRASCFEPEQTLSGVRWTNGLIYYQTPKDASTNFYFDRLPKGTYILEYPVYVNRAGKYSNGITTIQCMYAPQYVSHTEGITIMVND